MRGSRRAARGERRRRRRPALDRPVRAGACASRTSRIFAATSADSAATEPQPARSDRGATRLGTATAPTAPSTAATGSRSGHGSTSARPSSRRCSSPATAVRSFSVVVEPVPPARARSAVEAAVTSDEADEQLRRERGFRTTARRRKQQAATRRREAELADGHEELRFAGFITVSARDDDELERELPARSRRPRSRPTSTSSRCGASRTSASSAARCRSATAWRAAGCWIDEVAARRRPAADTARRRRRSRRSTRSSPRRASAAAASTSAATSTAARSPTTRSRSTSSAR